MSISEAYKDGRWYKRRTEIFTRDKFACVLCGSPEDIQCHHHWYVKDRQIWEYSDEELSTLCRKHHEVLTEAQHLMRASLCKVGPSRFVHLAKTILESDGPQRCAGIAIQATNDETHKFRLHRLKSLISDLLDDPTSPLNLVTKLTDDKGVLWVDWKMFYTNYHKQAVETAWLSMGEFEVRHTEAF